MLTEDGSIIHKCLNGDSSAFGFLVDKYRESIYAFAYDKLHNFHDAEDVTQEVFIKAYQKLRSLKYWDRFAFWLCSIASNECKMFHRSRSREPDRDFIEDQELPTKDTNIQEPDFDFLHESLNLLPKIYREALTLHYLGDMSAIEIAKASGVAPTAIRQRLVKARKMLGIQLGSVIKAFDSKKLPVGFTFRIVKTIKQTRIQPVPRSLGLPLSIGMTAFILSAIMILGQYMNIEMSSTPLAGAPLYMEAQILETGEIPVDSEEVSPQFIISEEKIEEDEENPGNADDQDNEGQAFLELNGISIDEFLSTSGMNPNQQRLKKYPKNPIWPKKWGGVRAMASMVIYENGRYRMWYSSQIDGEVKSFINHATSKDGIDWTNHKVVMEPQYEWESQNLAEPFVMRDDNEKNPDNRYKMWYTGHSRYISVIAYATSSDGINWTKHPDNPIISSNPMDGFTEPGMGSIIYDEDQYKMWYHARTKEDGEPLRIILYATSPNGVDWSNHEQIDWIENKETKVLDPFVIKPNDTFYMFYAHYGNDPYANIRYASSQDGLTWQNSTQNPVLTRGRYAAWDGSRINEPSILLYNSELKLWYTGYTGGIDNSALIGYANFNSNESRFVKRLTSKSSPERERASNIQIEENYNNLSVNQALPEWSEGVFAQNKEFVSPPMGAMITKVAPKTYRTFPLLKGKVAIEIWMKPKAGKDTVNSLCIGNANNHSEIFWKNDEDKWWYKRAPSKDINSVSFADYDGNWHHFKFIYDTRTNRYNLYMNDHLVADNVLWELDLSDGISHIGINSGRFEDTVSYFDDLRIYSCPDEPTNITTNGGKIRRK